MITAEDSKKIAEDTVMAALKMLDKQLTTVLDIQCDVTNKTMINWVVVGIRKTLQDLDCAHKVVNKQREIEEQTVRELQKEKPEPKAEVVWPFEPIPAGKKLAGIKVDVLKPIDVSTMVAPTVVFAPTKSGFYMLTGQVDENGCMPFSHLDLVPGQGLEKVYTNPYARFGDRTVYPIVPVYEDFEEKPSETPVETASTGRPMRTFTPYEVQAYDVVVTVSGPEMRVDACESRLYLYNGRLCECIGLGRNGCTVHSRYVTEWTADEAFELLPSERVVPVSAFKSTPKKEPVLLGHMHVFDPKLVEEAKKKMDEVAVLNFGKIYAQVRGPLVPVETNPSDMCVYEGKLWEIVCTRGTQDDCFIILFEAARSGPEAFTAVTKALRKGTYVQPVVKVWYDYLGEHSIVQRTGDE